MKELKKYFLLVLFSYVLLSCYEDKGNYDYTGNEKITIENIEEWYTKTAYQQILTIEPDVSSSLDGELEYTWYLYMNSYDNKADTISRTLDLVFPVDIPQGEYKLTLGVKNKKTLFTEYSSTRLSVVTDFSLGWYVQKEINGNTELDLHKMTGEVSENLIEKTQDKLLSGKPISFNVIGGFRTIIDNKQLTINALSLVSETDILLLSTIDMSLIYNHDNLFFRPNSKDEKSYRMFTNRKYVGYISTEGFYYQAMNAPAGSGKFGSPLKMSDGSQVALGNHFIYTNSSYCSGMMYDDLNQRFLGLQYNGSFFKFSEKDASDKPMDDSPNGTGCKILYLGRNGASNKASALLENVTTKKRYIYNLNTSYMDKSNYCNPIIRDAVFEIPSTSQINSSTLFCQNETISYLYYANGNKLSAFDNLKGIELSNIKSFGANETITSIQHLYWTAPFDLERNFDHLVIGTTNGDDYNIYLFNILAGQPDGEPVKVLKGKGRPNQVQFFTSVMNNASDRYYPL